MDARQEDSLSMRIVTVDVLENAAPGVLSRMPQIESVRDELKAKVEKLRGFKNGQVLNRTGNRMTKDELRVAMTHKGYETAAAVKAYAIAEGNTVLRMEVTYVMSDFEKMRDTDVADACTSIFDVAEALLVELADYGVTLLSLNELKDSILMFNLALPKTRAGIVTKTTFTERIAELFAETDVLLFRIDNLVNMVRFSESLFYREYYGSRKIVNTGNRKLSLRGTITDESGLPLDKVVVTVESTNEVSAKSTKKGNYRFKGVEGGFWAVTFKREGFVTEKVFLAFTPNLRLDFSIVLKRVEEQVLSA